MDSLFIGEGKTQDSREKRAIERTPAITIIKVSGWFGGLVGG